MIKMNVPDFITGRQIYEIYYKLKADYPEAFFADTEIASVFGCFPGCIWNGGGTDFRKPTSKRIIVNVIRFFNEELNLPLRFTFTNPMLQEKHLTDTYGNLIAELGHNGKNEILTSSALLENYLREKYPNYKYCSSIVGTHTMPYGDLNKYNLVVIRRKMNNNWDFLNEIPLQYRHKIEFLCNDPCPDDCPRIYSHYRDLGRAQLEFNPDADNLKCSMGHIRGQFEALYTKTLKTYISRETILNDYLPKGFNQFKLSGRCSPENITLNMLEYFVQPDYRPDLMRIFIEPYLQDYEDNPPY